MRRIQTQLAFTEQEYAVHRQELAQSRVGRVKRVTGGVPFGVRPELLAEPSTIHVCFPRGHQRLERLKRFFSVPCPRRKPDGLRSRAKTPGSARARANPQSRARVRRGV